MVESTDWRDELATLLERLAHALRDKGAPDEEVSVRIRLATKDMSQLLAKHFGLGG